VFVVSRYRVFRQKRSVGNKAEETDVGKARHMAVTFSSGCAWTTVVGGGAAMASETAQSTLSQSELMIDLHLGM
jgi:hypothetical protein